MLFDVSSAEITSYFSLMGDQSFLECLAPWLVHDPQWGEQLFQFAWGRGVSQDVGLSELKLGKSTLTSAFWWIQEKLFCDFFLIVRADAMLFLNFYILSRSQMVKYLWMLSMDKSGSWIGEKTKWGTICFLLEQAECGGQTPCEIFPKIENKQNEFSLCHSFVCQQQTYPIT